MRGIVTEKAESAGLAGEETAVQWSWSRLHRRYHAMRMIDEGQWSMVLATYQWAMVEMKFTRSRFGGSACVRCAFLFGRLLRSLAAGRASSNRHLPCPAIHCSALHLHINQSSRIASYGRTSSGCYQPDALRDALERVQGSAWRCMKQTRSLLASAITDDM